MKKTAAILLVLLLLSGCRVRTTLTVPLTPDAPESAVPETVSTAEPEPTPEPKPSPTPEASPEPTPEPTPEPSPEPEPDSPPEPQEEPGEQEEPATDPDAPTQEDEDSQRREFDDSTSGEVTPEAEEPIYTPQEEPTEAQLPVEGDGGDSVNTEAEEAELTATQTVSADEAEELGSDESGETADSIQTYYLTLLDSRLGAMFECQRLYVYWETGEEYRTVLKGSKEHKLILGAGAYNVSAKLLEENLTVDAGWVCRKNPDVIVKVVDRASLEQGAALCQALADRPDWSGIAAVREGHILLLAKELLDTQAGQVGAMLYLAKLMYPEEMEDVDPDEALRALTEEASGIAASGRYAYGI